MHAIVRLGNGEYYVSAVFGYYNNIVSKDEYQRYLESLHSPYYIVWNREKTHLVRVFEMQQNTHYLIPQVLLVDNTVDNWVMNDQGIGGVHFLPRVLADELSVSEVLPQDIKERCVAIDAQFVYEPYHEVVNEQDIENLSYAAGYFHDAYIKKQKTLEDGTLYLLFDDVWGCSIEMWLWDDVQYDVSSLDPEKYAPYWMDSTILLQDGFIYFVNDGGMTVDKINSDYCWFRSRHMKYHVIPD